MDRRLFDILWEVYRDVDGKQPIQIISAYRSPATNAMLRRRSSGVARFSQHMLGHAMDFYIPGVPLEQIRAAGLRLQRGGVGFYPTSGSPFVHLDTGSIRHWPRMTHDQLARVFPDGRTVHLPSDGKPLKGYRAGAAPTSRSAAMATMRPVSSKPSLFLASLFRGKSADEDDEGAAPRRAGQDRAGKAADVKVAEVKPAEPKIRRSGADAARQTGRRRRVPARLGRRPDRAGRQGRRKPASRLTKTEAEAADPGRHHQRPRLLGRHAAAEAGHARPRSPRSAPARPSPPPIRNRPPAFPTARCRRWPMRRPPSPVERAHVVAASAPIPRSVRPASAARNPMAVTNDHHGGRQERAGRARPGSVVATSTRLAAASRDNDVWMRAMILAPSASTSMSSTVFGDTDMTIVRAHFVKPQAIVAMTLLGRSAAGPGLRPVHRLGDGDAVDHVVRDATAALR